MRLHLLFILLVCLLLQLWIAADASSFARLFGEPITMQAIAFSWALFFALGLVEALILIIWVLDVDRRIEEGHREIRYDEDEAITRTGVGLKDERSRGLSRVVQAFRVRLRSMFRLQNESVTPIFFLAGLLLALGMLLIGVVVVWE